MTKGGMSKPRGANPVAAIKLDDAREQAIDLLSECFARDVLEVEDFERRVGLAHAAGSMAELGAAIEGLGNDADAATATRDESHARPGRRAPAATLSEVRATDRAVAVFGETRRTGGWVPARSNTVVAVMGSAVIDLREARLGPGPTAFSVLAFMGSVELVVPPRLHVQCGGSAVFGSFEQRESGPAPAAADAPVIRVDGVSVLGSVEIEVRHAGESKREARRRRRLEKKKRRKLRR